MPKSLVFWTFYFNVLNAMRRVLVTTRYTAIAALVEYMTLVKPVSVILNSGFYVTDTKHKETLLQKRNIQMRQYKSII